MPLQKTYIIFAVVWLRALVTSGVGPVSESALIGGWDLGFGSGPEPSVDEEGLQIGTVASVKITFTSTGPDVFDTICESSILLNG